MLRNGSAQAVAVTNEGDDCLSGGGEMGRLMRSMDWSATGLGAPQSWPQSLKTSVSICLSSRFPIVLWWGEQLQLLYNDAWRPALGALKHPAVAKPGCEVWSEIWHIIGPQLESVMAKGEATWSEDMLLPMDRYGYLEETYWTYSYSPIRIETGEVGGVFTAVSETTERVLSARRLQTLREVAEQASSARSARDACLTALAKLERNIMDVPFAMIYTIAPDGRQAELAGTSNLSDQNSVAAPVIRLGENGSRPGIVTECIAGGAVVTDQRSVAPQDLLRTAWPVPPSGTIALPIRRSGRGQTAAVLVCGINAGRKLDEGYRSFFELLAGHIGTAIDNALAIEHERARAEELAALDRAKTAFFSNISHEFRTPLTLMLGPIEELLDAAQSNLPPESREQVRLLQRNSLRLQRLVNSLLDFARIEAGRMQAEFVPTDLPALTTDLASLFRAAIEHAGMELVTDCRPLPEPAYVDRDMWEKIVSNLLSNAFKHTFDGKIEVSLHFRDDAFVLKVSDTGVGIPQSEIPHIFERFRRVSGSRGRTLEGSGIGLALVHELVKLHGGTVAVESRDGQGSCFTVTIPSGRAHLPADRVSNLEKVQSEPLGAQPYVDEVLGWLPVPVPMPDWGEPMSELLGNVPDQSRTPRILLADDNADMRDYISRLLRSRYQVTTYADGLTALEGARQERPDLILTDVMMPGMDGFAFLRELRADPRLSTTPFIMLSARAGEEARVEGLKAGADEYLVKPFGARELLARVEGLLKLTQARKESEERFQELADNAPVMIWVSDPEGACTYINTQWCRFTGTEATDNLGAGWLERLHPLDREGTARRFAGASRDKAPLRLEYRLRRHDGAFRWVIDSAHPHFGPNGAFLGYIGSVFDIHERKEYENEISRLNRTLRMKLDELATLLDVLPVGIGIALDRECRDIRTNRTFASYLGIEARSNASLTAPEIERPAAFKVLGKDGREVPPEELPMQHAARTGETIERLELDIVRADGVTVRLLEYAAPLFDEEGRTRGSVGAFIDITERTRIEARQSFLMRLDDTLRNIADPNEIIAASAKVLGEHLQVSRCAYAEVESDQDSMLLTGNYVNGVASIVGRYKFSDFGAEVHRLMREGRPFVVHDIAEHSPALHVPTYAELEIKSVICVPLHKKGRFAAAMAVHSATPRRWSDDEVELLQLVASRCWESIERARVARTLRESEERLRSVLETTPECVKIVNDEAIITYINGSGLSVFEADSEGQVIGGSVLSFISEEQREFWLQNHRRVISGERISWKYQVVGLKGAVRWMESHAVPLKLPDGSTAQLAVTRDISDRIRVERERETLLESEMAARAESERVNRMKDEFLATLSHELRTPLNAILGWAQLLARGNRSKREYAQGLEAIERGARAQAQLIEDLLDMNRIISGKIRLDVQEVELTQVVEAAIQAVEPALKAKQIQLERRINAEIPVIAGDPSRLQQVVWNLLTNAAKFTPPGGTVTVAMARDVTGIEITVADTGVGIKPEFLPFVFERFRQQDSSIGRRHGGLGLGLSIVKQLVELHGGSMRVSSAGEGLGASFTVALPVQSQLRSEPQMDPQKGAIAPRQSPVMTEPNLSSMRIVVIDDDRDARELVRHILTGCGAEVFSASSADEGLSLVQSKLPHLLVSDIGMPDVDGYELIRRVRALPSDKGRETPAIALTAFARAEDRKRAIEVGFQLHVSKPVEPAELINSCATLIRAKQR